MFRIPVQDLNDQLMELSLSGATYYLRLMWNGTAEYWSADISDSSRSSIITGVAISPDFPLFQPSRSTALPVGLLMCLAPDRRDTISYLDLVNGTVQLFYVEPDDLDVT